MTDNNRRHDEAQDTEWEEPVFEAEEIDEPVFDDEPSFEQEEPNRVITLPLRGRSYGDEAIDEEPVFETDDSTPSTTAIPIGMESVARGSAAGGVGLLSQKPKRSSGQPVAEGEGVVHWPGSEAVVQPRNRRLGRTGPFWFIVAGMAIVFLFAIWYGFLRGGGDENRDLALTPVAAGISGSTTLPVEAELIEPTPEAPTPTPMPVLTVNQSVVVGNTGGQGIRLRSQPSTSGQTLAIYQDGDQFVVLAPDGDYSSYPVEADNYRWYRIQVAGNPEENLTGWAAGNFLVPVEE